MAWVFVNQTKFYLHDDESLLTGLLRVGIDAKFECQQGYCGTCKLKYQPQSTTTQVSYDSEPLVMLESDEILACCCRVKGVIKLI